MGGGWRGEMEGEHAAYGGLATGLLEGCVRARNEGGSMPIGEGVVACVFGLSQGLIGDTERIRLLRNGDRSASRYR